MITSAITISNALATVNSFNRCWKYKIECFLKHHDDLRFNRRAEVSIPEEV